MLGTAVAMIVLSSATSEVLSMTAPSTGPRSERRPTEARVTGGAEVMRRGSSGRSLAATPTGPPGFPVRARARRRLASFR